MDGFSGPVWRLPLGIEQFARARKLLGEVLYATRELFMQPIAAMEANEGRVRGPYFASIETAVLPCVAFVMPVLFSLILVSLD